MTSEEMVSDELWVAVEPLLPPKPPKPKGGRPRRDDLAALGGIFYVLKSGIPWRMLPKELGCREPSDLLAALRDWQKGPRSISAGRQYGRRVAGYNPQFS
jgi:transposase